VSHLWGILRWFNRLSRDEKGALLAGMGPFPLAGELCKGFTLGIRLRGVSTIASGWPLESCRPLSCETAILAQRLVWSVFGLTRTFAGVCLSLPLLAGGKRRTR